MEKRFLMFLGFGVWLSFGGGGFGSAALADDGGADDETRLVGHEAVYELRSVKISADSGILDAVGELRLDYRRDCEGWTGLSDIDLELVLGAANGGGVVHFESVESFFERLDGAAFDFNSIERMDGVDVAASRGRAERALLGGNEGLFVEFSVPRGEERSLPAGVFLPMAQTEEMIEAAIEGQHFLQTEIFNGTATSEYYIYSSLIGTEILAGDYEGWILREDVSPRGWRMHHAIFDPAERGSAPDFEISMTMMENGIMADFIADYGDYQLEGELVSLTVFDVPLCK